MRFAADVVGRDVCGSSAAGAEPLLLLMTASSAAKCPAAQASINACSVVPSWEARTASLTISLCRQPSDQLPPVKDDQHADNLQRNKG